LKPVVRFEFLVQSG